MKNIVIVGAGGMAREVKALIAEINRQQPTWNFLGYIVTDLNAVCDRDSRDEVLGDYSWLREHASDVDAVAIGIGYPKPRLRVAEHLEALLPELEFPPLIHPTASVDLFTAQIGKGVLVCSGVVGTVNLVLGDFSLCNFGCTLGHETELGRGSVVNPGANISGGVKIGTGVLIGTGAQVLQYLSVGDHAIVGAGAVVTKNVAAGLTAIGVPAKPDFARDAKKTMTTPAPWPYFADDEVEAAVRVLRSGKVNYWTGEEGRLFEKEFAESVGCKHAIALANGTVALEAALKALGIGPGDDVITTSRTFIASASCAVAVGARPVIADVDPESQNITAETIRAALTRNTKAIVAVHLAGWPCDMDPIMELARERGLKVVEDCAQAQGASYKGCPVGSIGDAAAFSFCQDKIMTTGGEGGMLTTNDEAVWDQAWSYKDHGKSYDAVYNRKHAPGFRWLHDSFGTNWRLTEMQSAIGRVTLRKVPAWVEIRRRYAQILNEKLAGLEALRLTRPPATVYHSYYKYYAFVRPEQLQSGWNRDRIMNEINARGVPCFSGSCSEIYLENAFTPEMHRGSRLKDARELGETSLMFLVHPTLTEENIHKAAQVITDVVLSATKIRVPRARTAKAGSSF